MKTRNKKNRPISYHIRLAEKIVDMETVDLRLDNGRGFPTVHDAYAWELMGNATDYNKWRKLGREKKKAQNAFGHAIDYLENERGIRVYRDDMEGRNIKVVSTNPHYANIEEGDFTRETRRVESTVGSAGSHIRMRHPERAGQLRTVTTRVLDKGLERQPALIGTVGHKVEE